VSPNLPWQILGTEECLDRWQDREEPSTDLSFLVAEWLVSKLDDPYQGMRRVPELPNLWFGKVSRSDHGADSVVVCTSRSEGRLAWPYAAGADGGHPCAQARP